MSSSGVISVLIAGYVRHPVYCGLCALTFGLCAITGSQARLALSIGFWFLMNHKASFLKDVRMHV